MQDGVAGIKYHLYKIVQNYVTSNVSPTFSIAVSSIGHKNMHQKQLCYRN